MREQLVEAGVPKEDVERYIAYVNQALNDEQRKGDGKGVVDKHNTDELFQLFMKYWRLGVPINGVDAAITGKNVVMVSYHGYKNKVLSSYPETLLDIQLVRETDVFKVKKDSGRVEYTHELKDVFDNKPIVGAYVVIKNKRGEFLEILNKADFESMKKSGKMQYLWNTWESEFWLKSVIKRACKRHFNDITAEIDKLDNDNFGAAKPGENQNEGAPLSAQAEETIKDFNSSKTLEDLHEKWNKTELKNIPEVVKAKDDKKKLLEEAKVETN